MPLFEKTIEVNRQQISVIVLQRWHIKLDKSLKCFQNHTFLAYKLPTISQNKMQQYQQKQQQRQQQKCVVRVTPDPEGKLFERIKNQLDFVNYCSLYKLNNICSPIYTVNGKKQLSVLQDNLIIVVFQWARGQLPDYMCLKWMNDSIFQMAWGRFLGQLHKISRKFSKDHPEIVSKMNHWHQIHNNLLNHVKLHQNDEKLVNDPQYYGVVHGDLNITNFFYDKQRDCLSVFDTEQVHRGFYEWDIAQAVFQIIIIKQAGMPCSGEEVPGVDVQKYQKNIVKGYESVGGIVDLERLKRMVDMKRQFYRCFGRQALIEGYVPEDMKQFLLYCSRAFFSEQQKKLLIK